MNDNQCVWTQEDEGGEDWFTDCGKTFMLMEEGPADNGFKFCPFCGKSIAQEDWTDDA